MQVSDFKTKTEFIEQKNKSKDPAYWPIALDIGYSAVKGYSSIGRFRFPSFARMNDGNKIFDNANSSDNIEYMDENGEHWNVGESAYQDLSNDDVDDDEKSLYGRYRYTNPMFLVIARVGLALACSNKEGDYKAATKTILLQTGLPPKYLKQDAGILRDTLAGTHKFKMRLGNGPWKEYNITIKSDNIHIMSQPTGSLVGVGFKNDATPIKNITRLYSSKVLIFDAGFGTLDTFSLKNNVADASNTFNNLGMKAVFMDVLNTFANEYHQEIPIHFFQNCLKEGHITIRDRIKLTSKKIKFDKVLANASKKTCTQAIKKVAELYDLTDYQYLVVTGGTGECWYEQIKKALIGLETLTVLPGNNNDKTVEQVYSNVRGYYISALLKTAPKKEGK